MNPPARRPTAIKPAQHLALIAIVFLGALLIGYFTVQKRMGPELQSTRSKIDNSKREITEIRKFIASTDSPEIGDLRRMISEREAQVRTYEFQREGDGGVPFVNTADRQAVEHLLARIVAEARVQQLAILADEPSSGEQIDRRFAKLVTRQLRLEGSYQQLYRFITRLRGLPQRVLILELDVKEIHDFPGLLDINLVVSV